MRSDHAPRVLNVNNATPWVILSNWGGDFPSHPKSSLPMFEINGTSPHNHPCSCNMESHYMKTVGYLGGGGGFNKNKCPECRAGNTKITPYLVLQCCRGQGQHSGASRSLPLRDGGELCQYLPRDQHQHSSTQLSS